MMNRFKLVVLGVLLLAVALPGFAQRTVKEYTANQVSGTPPVMDGSYSDAEWGNVPWASGMFGLDNQGSNGANQGQPVSLNYRWRAVWDQNYLYMLIVGESYDLPINGIREGQIVQAVGLDDDVYSFAFGIGHDLEIYLEPNWRDGDGFNSNPPDFTDSGGAVTDGYHFVWPPLQADQEGTTIYAPSNTGNREANPDGPPWLFSEANYNSTYIGNTAYNPIFTTADSAALGALPYKMGTSLGLTGAEPGQSTPFAHPVLEIAIPFSQMNSAFGIPAEGLPGETNCELVADANGNYVRAGDEWLVNVCSYTDPITAADGLTLVTWNNVIGGPFASYPRGILRFAAAGTVVQDWMLN